MVRRKVYPFSNDAFLCSDIPPDILTVHICVMNRGKRAKDTEVAELTVDLASLKSSRSDHEEWYPLSGVTPIGTKTLVYT
jgi:Ras GTPase-activating protein 1